jgi:hypothetical protein
MNDCPVGTSPIFTHACTFAASGLERQPLVCFVAWFTECGDANIHLASMLANAMFFQHRGRVRIGAHGALSERAFSSVTSLKVYTVRSCVPDDGGGVERYVIGLCLCTLQTQQAYDQ